MTFKKDTLIIALGALSLIAISGYFFYTSQQATPRGDAQDTINSIATLSIKNETLDEATVAKFTENFNSLRDKFLKDQTIQNFFVINALARIKQDVGDYKGAEEAFLFAYNLDPGGYVINGNIANLYQYGLKEYDKAEKFYLDTLAIKNIQSGNHYTYFAETYELYYYRLEDTTKAEALLDRALAELPDNLKVFALAAEHYRREADIERARELYEKILEIAPDDPVANKGLESLN